MSRSLDIAQALKYPWQNKKDALFIPSVFMLLYIIAVYAGAFLSMAIVGFDVDNPESLQDNPLYMAMNMGVSFLSCFLFLTPWLGFIWELMSQLRSNFDYNAPAPSWQGNVGRFWVNGMKYFIFSAILTSPLLAAYIYFVFNFLGNQLATMLIALVNLAVLTLIMPLLFSALVNASQSKSFGDLFDFGAMLRIAGRCYGKAWLAALLMWVFTMCAAPIYVLACCTCIGYPIAITYVSTMSMHLIIQAYDGYRP